MAIAQAWSQHLASTGTLAHDRQLANLAPSEWMKLGENVGTGPTCDAIATAFWNSPEHKVNIMDPAFSVVGIATVDVNGIIYVTEDFMATSLAPARQAAAAPKAVQPVPVVAYAPAPAPTPVLRTGVAAPVTTPPPAALTSTQAPPAALTSASGPPAAAAPAPHAPHRGLLQRVFWSVGSFFSNLF